MKTMQVQMNLFPVYQQLYHLYYRYIGMTIINDNDANVPGWKKSNNFLAKNRNVIIEKGEDGTGNLLSIDNFNYCYSKYANSMEIITADGGFDFSHDFNKQEINMD